MPDRGIQLYKRERGLPETFLINDKLLTDEVWVSGKMLSSGQQTDIFICITVPLLLIPWQVLRVLVRRSDSQFSK